MSSKIPIVKSLRLAVAFTSLFSIIALHAHAQILTVSEASGIMQGCVNTPSASPNFQQFTISGASLSADAVVTAPANFEVSFSTSSGFASSVSLSPIAGTIPNTIIYVRLVALSTPGLRTGNVTISSTGATGKSVAVSGRVYALPAMAAVSNKVYEHGTVVPEIGFTSTSGGSLFNWTNTNTTIGLAASGQGNIPGFTAVNTGLVPVQSTITVTPVSTGFAFIPSGDYIKVVSTESRELVKTIAVGSMPTGVAVSPDGTKAFVSNQNSDNVTVININTLEVVTTIAVGANPTDVVVNPGGTRVYVLNTDASTVSVINTASNAVIATIPVTASLPSRLAIHPVMNRLYVSGVSQISEINTTTNAQVNTYTIGNALTVITGMAVDPMVGHVYVSDGGVAQNKVHILAIDFGIAVQGSITTPAGPDGIVISPDGLKAYIAISENDAVAIADLNTRSIVTSVAVVQGPEWLALSPDGNYLYAQSNFFTGDISVVNTVTRQPAGELNFISNGGSGNFISGGTGCSGTSTTFTITVNPKLPEIIASKPAGAIVACEGEASADPHVSGITISGINMKSGITVTAPANFQVSLTSSSGFGSSLVIPTSASIVAETTVYVRSSASAPAGELAGSIALTATDAITRNVNIRARVSAEPTVDPVPDQEFISGLETNSIFFGGNASEYSWTNSDPTIGLPAIGKGPIFSFLAAEGIETPITATITVTPKSSSLAYIPFNDDFNPQLAVMDIAGREIIWTYGMPGITNALAFSPDNKFVYAASVNQVNIVNTQTRRNEASIEIDGRGEAMAITPDGSKLFVATHRDKIVVINTATRSIITTLDALSVPSRMLLSKNGQSLFVSYTDSNIHIFNTSTYAQTGSINFSIPVSSMIFNADQSLLYAAHPSHISVVNTATGQIIDTIAVTGAQRMAITPDDRYIFVTRPSSNMIAVADAFTNTFVKYIETGIFPNGVGISGDGLLAYVFNFNSSSLSIINIATLTVLQTLSLPQRPYATLDFMVSGAGCSGPSTSFTITILPPPPAIGVTAPRGSIETCEGVASASPEVQMTYISGTRLTAAVTLTAPAGFEVSTSSLSGFSSDISLSPTGQALDSIMVYIRASALAPAGTITGMLELSSPGAETMFTEVRAIIYPKPSLDIPENVSFVHGEATKSISFTGSEALNYNWTNSSTAIGLPAGGAGGVPSFTATNPGSTPITANVTVKGRTAVYAYLPHNTLPNTLSVINTETGVVEKNIGLSTFGTRTAVAPDGKHVYVALLNKTVVIINTATNSIVKTISAGGYVTHILITSDSKKVYAFPTGRNAICIEAETNTVTEAPFGGANDDMDIVLDETNGLVYYAQYLQSFDFSVPTATMISQVSMETGELIKFKAVTHETLTSAKIRISPDGQRLYVMSGEKRITALNTNLDIVREVHFDLYLNPYMEFTRSGEFLFVADAGGNFHRVNTATYEVDIIDPPGDITIDQFNLLRSNIYRLTSSSFGQLSVLNNTDGSLIRDIPAGEFASAFGPFLTQSSGCTTADQVFSITVYPAGYALPVISATAISGEITTCINSPEDANVESVTVTAQHLNDDLIVAAPDGFEISLLSEGSFSGQIVLEPVSGSVNQTVYVRVSAADVAGYITGDLVLTSTGSNTIKVNVLASIIPLPAVTGSTLPNGTVGQAYSYMLPQIQYGVTYSAEGLPAGLTMSAGGTISGTPSSAGNAVGFIVLADNGSCQAGAMFTITIAKGAASITITNSSQTYDGSPKSVTVITNPTGLPVTVTYNGSNTPPSGASTYPVQVTINSPDYQGSKLGSMTISKASASVSITNTEQTYTGTSRAVTIITVPTGLPVTVRYNGSATVPVNAGTYAVQVTVNSANYQGTATASLVVAKANASVSISNTEQTYTGELRPIGVTTVPSSLPVTVTYNGSATVPVNAGTYPIQVTVNSANYTATKTGSLLVSKKQLDVTAQDKTRLYGTNNPELTLSYAGFVNGETVAVVDELPAASTTATSGSDAGQYAISVTGGSDNNYSLVLHPGTLTIGKLDQTIDFTGIDDQTTKSVPFTVTATASSGLPVTFSIASGPATISGSTVTLTGDPGEVTVRATQAGTVNLNPASADQKFTVTLVLGEDLSYARSVKIYPNPASHTIAIKIPAELIHAHVELINTQGVVALTRDFSGTEMLELALEGLPQGVYIVRIKNEQALVTRKLVIR